MDLAVPDNRPVERFLAEAEYDEVGLWQIAKAVEGRLGINDDAREATLSIVRELLSLGMQAGDPPYSAHGYRPWPDQDPDAVIDRIRREWVALGRTPTIPDIAWFGLKANHS
jgi:hypothetical protein